MGTEFVDVTLACEDGQQLEAHKFVLVASSPFFQNLLSRNKHPHPLIYMRGVRSDDLVAIVDFLYYGEANVYQENIDGFLALAEELKLKGLTGNDDKTEIEEQPIFKQEIKRNKTKPRLALPKCETIPNEKPLTGLDVLNRTPDTTVAVPSHRVTSVNITDVQELDVLVKSMMTRSQNNNWDAEGSNLHCLWKRGTR